jgi:hypothetical protein
MTGLDLLLLAGLSARLTRFVVYDDAGTIVRAPLFAGGRTLLGERGAAWIYDLLACPFCIGWWLSLMVAGSWYLWAGTIWQAFAAAGTVSYIVGHVAVRADERG